MASLTFGLALASLVTAAPAPSLLSRDNPNLVQAFAVDFPDPCVFYNGQTSTYWAYASNSTDGSLNIQMANSPDGKTWTYLAGQDALPNLDAWHNWAATSPFTWAPSVVQNDVYQYVMYYTAIVANNDAGKHCIGVATSWDPAGPFTSYPDPFICHLETGGPGTIDPAAFLDADGSRYVVYKKDGNSDGTQTTIMLQKVDGNGVKLIGDPVAIMSPDALDGNRIEAPSLVLKDGTYTLFFSSNAFDSQWYDIAYGMSNSITGPYTKAGPFATTSSSGLFAPGGADVSVHNPSLMVFHAGKVGSRFMYTANIGIDGARKFVAGGS